MTRKGAIAPIVIGVLGTAILLMLGAWQLQRLEWKQGLIAAIEAKIDAEPVPLPEAPTQAEDHLRRVTATGILGTEELHALHAVKNRGPGYRLIVPMDLGARRILVDLGFVPERDKDRIPREGSVRWQPDPQPGQVMGLLAWPNETGDYTPEPDLGRNIWFARDVDAMARAMGTDPVLLVAETHPDDAVVLPQPPSVDLPNRHLEYAFTWFGLATAWVFMSIYWLVLELRKPRD